MDYLKELMLNKRNQTQKNTYFVILFMWSTKTGCWLLLSGKEITERRYGNWDFWDASIFYNLFLYLGANHVCVFSLWKFTKLYVCNIYTFLWSYCVWVYSCELEGEKTPRMNVSKMLMSFLTFLLNSVNVHILKLWKNMIMNYSLKCFLKTSWNIFWYCLRI